MPAQACFNCEHIRTAFAERIAKGEKFRCTDCGTTIPTANTDQFWLLTGSVPTGPFSIAQIHSKLSAGEITQQTSACIVGGSNWLPLIQTPGIGPPAVPKAENDNATSSSPVSAQTPPIVPSTPQERYWLLNGSDLTGPFAVAEILAKLRAGALHADTKARLVGSEVWSPVAEALGSTGNPSTGTNNDQLEIQPPPLPGREPTPSQARGVEEPPPLTRRSDGGTRGGTLRQGDYSEEIPPPLPPTPLHATTNTSGAPFASPPTSSVPTPEWVKFAIFVLLAAGVLFGGYLAYRQIQPLTAMEVCKKWEAAKTPADAKKYVTPRFYQLMEALDSAKSPSDPNDTFDWTQEIDGPQPNLKLVGFRGSWFDQEAGKRVRVEGHLRLVKADGWKIDDMVFTGIEGTLLPGPVSAVDELNRAGKLPKSATPSTATPKSPATPSSKTASTPSATETKDARVRLIQWGFETFGWPGAVLLGVVVVAVAVAQFRDAYQSHLKEKQAKGSQGLGCAGFLLVGSVILGLVAALILLGVWLTSK